MMIDPLLPTILKACFALLFGLAALHKIQNPRETQDIIKQYEVLPPALSPVAVWAVAVLEGSIALGLLVNLIDGVAAIAGAALLSLYALVIAINLHRGRRDLNCGCSFGSGHQGLSEALVGRNIVLAALLLGSLTQVSDRFFGALDVFTLVASSSTRRIVRSSRTNNTHRSNQSILSSKGGK